MKKLACTLGVCLGVWLLIVPPIMAQSNRWEITPRDPNGSYDRFSNSIDVEMRRKYDYDPSSKYRGTLDDDGYIRMRNYNGETLRGYIDDDGYGKLRDDDGNVFRVRPQ